MNEDRKIPKELSWKNMKSRDDFVAWRKNALDYYRKVIGIDSDYEICPLETAITESVQINSNLDRKRIDYATKDGLRIPAFLFVPKTESPVPAVVVYHGHGDGKINAAEREGTNENALARYIAETLGYVVLAPDSRSFGEFQMSGGVDHAQYFQNLISEEKMYMTKLMEDGFQDMALLRSIPEVDMKRIGIAGVSMGSWRALNTAVLHEEIRATVVAGLYLPWAYFFSERHCACQHIPALSRKMSAEDLGALVFPRDLMIQWGMEDKFFKMGAEELMARTKEIADFVGCPEHFAVDIHSGMDHMFSSPEIADFFRSRLIE